jgi:hypothetical protein
MKLSMTLIFVAAALAACSSSVTPYPVAGTWNLVADTLTGGVNTCTLTGQMELTQSGHNLGGNLPGQGVTVSCTATTGPSSSTQVGDNMVFGYVNGSGIQFNLAQGFVIASGNFTADGVMSGTTITVWYPQAGINVTGTSWSATLSQ